MITSKMWPLERQQGFLLICTDGLVSDIKWPSFKLDLEIIKTNILSNIYDDYLKSVTSGVLTRFSLIWPGDLVFDPMWPSFKLDLEITKTNILGKIHDNCFNKRDMMALYRSPEYHSTQGEYDLIRGTFLRNYFETRASAQMVTNTPGTIS